MYICTHNFCGYGEIGRHARLRIWCRKACRFESYYPHKTKCNSLNFSELHFFLFLEALNPFSVQVQSRFRLYLLRPTGLQEDTGSTGATIHKLFSVEIDSICQLKNLKLITNFLIDIVRQQLPQQFLRHSTCFSTYFQFHFLK